VGSFADSLNGKDLVDTLIRHMVGDVLNLHLQSF
jgi:hypothetical protein